MARGSRPEDVAAEEITDEEVLVRAKAWAVIPAAGVGRRMGAERPKQYLMLAGRSILDISCSRLLEHERIEAAVLALSADDAWFSSTALSDRGDVLRCEGGRERCHSVLNALDFLAASSGAQGGDWVLVHDAARPCLRLADVDALFSACEDQVAEDRAVCGALLAFPVRDTMKRASAEGCVAQTVDRDGLWHALTPQMFRFGALRQALRKALDDGFLVTDEASAMEYVGEAPLLVQGHADNLKITRPEDLAVAEFYLQQQAIERD